MDASRLQRYADGGVGMSARRSEGDKKQPQPPEDRPRTAVYVRRHMGHRPGAGGSPSVMAGGRAASTPRGRPGDLTSIGGTQLKTERWREAGEPRWPAPVEAGHHFDETRVDQVPFQRSTGYDQGDWRNELWLRSLRSPGVAIQNPRYGDCGAGIQELHEEWRPLPPSSPRQLAFSGATSSGRVGVPGKVDHDRWVERPVATGRFALKHMGGARYEFDLKSPRFAEDINATPHSMILAQVRGVSCDGFLKSLGSTVSTVSTVGGRTSIANASVTAPSGFGMPPMSARSTVSASGFGGHRASSALLPPPTPKP